MWGHFATAYLHREYEYMSATMSDCPPVKYILYYAHILLVNFTVLTEYTQKQIKLACPFRVTLCVHLQVHVYEDNLWCRHFQNVNNFIYAQLHDHVNKQEKNTMQHAF